MMQDTWNRAGRKQEGISSRAVASDHEYATLAKLLSGFPELVTGLGGNADAMLDEAGIAPEMLQDPCARLPLAAVGQLLEDAAARLGCPDLGLRLGENQAMITTMKPLDRLCRTAPTVRDALEMCSRHVSAFNSGLVMDMADQGPEGYHMVDFKLADGLWLFPQLTEQLLLLTHRSVVWLSSGFAQSRAVWFSHLNIGPPIAYARRFNTIVKFGQEFDALLLNEDDLRTGLAECNAEVFDREARKVAQDYPAEHLHVDRQVRQMIYRVLAESGECTRQNIAQMLGFQERTLNRHLFRRGTSFEAIRDNVKKNLAYRYLARPDLPLTEIAGRLGYSELAVLSRCCRRWFGTSPRQFRQNLQRSRMLAVPAVDRLASSPDRIAA